MDVLERRESLLELAPQRLYRRNKLNRGDKGELGWQWASDGGGLLLLRERRILERDFALARGGKEAVYHRSVDSPAESAPADIKDAACKGMFVRGEGRADRADEVGSIYGDLDEDIESFEEGLGRRDWLRRKVS